MGRTFPVWGLGIQFIMWELPRAYRGMTLADPEDVKTRVRRGQYVKLLPCKKLT